MPHYALRQTNLFEPIFTSKNITIFASDNEAFQRIFGARSALSESEPLEAMKFHIVHSLPSSSDLVNGITWPTLAGMNTTVTVAGNNRYIGSSWILSTETLINSGMVHIFGSLTMPPVLSAVLRCKSMGHRNVYVVTVKHAKKHRIISNRWLISSVQNVTFLHTFRRV